MAYVVYEPNRPQENAQPVHGSGAEVQDHDPIRNFIEEGLRLVRPLKTVVLGKRAVNCCKRRLSRSRSVRSPSTDCTRRERSRAIQQKRMLHWRVRVQRTFNALGLKLLAMSSSGSTNARMKLCKLKISRDESTASSCSHGWRRS